MIVKLPEGNQCHVNPSTQNKETALKIMIILYQSFIFRDSGDNVLSVYMYHQT